MHPGWDTHVKCLGETARNARTIRECLLRVKQNLDKLSLTQRPFLSIVRFNELSRIIKPIFTTLIAKHR